MSKADLDWKNLPFGYIKTDHNIRFTWRDGRWSEPELTSEETIPVHMAATCLHYGQECFEGLKAFEQKNGDVVVFRADENAKRIQRSCEKVFMPAPPEDLFLEAVDRVVAANRSFVPPYGTGAALYVRPLVIGTGPRVGVRPADEYMFVIFVTPVGPYFKTGFKPVKLIVEEDYDRAAPNGVGDVKVGGNYAAGLRATIRAKKNGFTEVLYLDAKEKHFIDESGPANFFGITKDGQYVTPDSHTILPSITNKCLVTLAGELGMRPVRRPVAIEEILHFSEAGCCGTAAIITPVKSITWKGEEIVYCEGDEPGPACSRLYHKLRAIQLGEEPDEHGWNHKVPEL